MATIVLGIGTSHTPLLSLPAELWPAYAEGDRRNPELVYPPNGWTLSYEEALDYVAPEVKGRYTGPEPFTEWAHRCQTSLDTLSCTLRQAKPDITIVVSDDQDEWFYEGNMPALSVFWADTAPIVPRAGGPWRDPEVKAAIAKGYGDVAMDVPVPSTFGRYLIEYLIDHDFDVAHMRYVEEEYGGRVARRYPKQQGEIDAVRETPKHQQGLPHGFAFIVKRLYCNEPGPILPVFQNTCYPPNRVTPRRCFQVGQAIAAAVKEWPGDDRVAIVASGGLSHFVVDEDLDRPLLDGLQRKDAEALKATPRHRLYSAASESMNWITLGGAMHDLPLQMELVDYVPVYRTPAATGGGWAFARWQ
jgi:3-O-methylgallate 3,4-dioxygenase